VKTTRKTLIPIAALVLVTAAAQEPVGTPEPTAPGAPGAEHAWLRQLVGEWDVVSEMSAGPDTEPIRVESTESARSIGDRWIVAEGTADFFGQPFTSILTLGYDPRREAYVGTWIDTEESHLWSYEGSLDEARDVLTLEAEGPALGDETRTARYRDAIEVVDSDHKVLTSSVLGDDGTWTTLMRAEFRRRR
jgi:hypothetical protein